MKPVNYVNNKEFNDLLIRYNEFETKDIFEKLGDIFLLLVENLAKKPNFINYTHDRKDDMKSDALYYMVRYIKTYDTTRGNPFAFFTQIAFNGFLQSINKNKRRAKFFVSLDYIDELGEDETYE